MPCEGTSSDLESGRARPARRFAKQQDAATGVLWLDDCQVCAVTIEKWIAAQGAAPGVAVTVEAVDDGQPKGTTDAGTCGRCDDAQ